jgi:hypothetical protein
LPVNYFKLKIEIKIEVEVEAEGVKKVGKRVNITE